MRPARPRSRLLRLRRSAVVFAVLALVAFAAVGGAHAADDAGTEAPAVFVTWQTGLDYSKGDYGLQAESRLIYVPLGATIDVDYWRFGITLPLLHADGVVGFIDRAPILIPEREENTGLGEAITSASYLFPPAAEGLPWIEVTGQVAWPTRTANVLGTGDFAFAGQVDVFRTIGDWTPFVRFGRNFFLVGSLDDRFYASVGATYAWNDRVSTGIAYDWLGRAVPGVNDGHELVPYASVAIDERWRLGPYAVIGQSSGSPDYGLGFSVSFAP